MQKHLKHHGPHVKTAVEKTELNRSSVYPCFW